MAMTQFENGVEGAEQLLHISYSQLINYMSRGINAGDFKNVLFNLYITFEVQSTNLIGTLKSSIVIDGISQPNVQSEGLYNSFDYTSCPNLPMLIALNLYTKLLQIDDCFEINYGKFHWELVALSDYKGLFLSVTNNPDERKLLASADSGKIPAKGFIYYNWSDGCHSQPYLGSLDVRGLLN